MAVSTGLAAEFQFICDCQDWADRSPYHSNLFALSAILWTAVPAAVPACRMPAPASSPVERDPNRALAREPFVPASPFANPPTPGMFGGAAIMKLPEIARTMSGVARIMPPARNIIMKKGITALGQE